MQTECSAEQFEFEGFGQRRVVAAFDAGVMTSDGGGLLLRHADRAIGLIERVAACFQDGREQDQVIHTLPALIGQRIVGIALGGACPRAGKAGPVGGRERSRRAAPRSGTRAVRRPA